MHAWRTSSYAKRQLKYITYNSVPVVIVVVSSTVAVETLAGSTFEPLIATTNKPSFQTQVYHIQFCTSSDCSRILHSSC